MHSLTRSFAVLLATFGASVAGMALQWVVPAQYLTENLVVTCSGNFSAPAFLCAVTALGIDNVLFSVDWPYESNAAAVDFLLRQPLAPRDLQKIAHLNAERILRL